MSSIDQVSEELASVRNDLSAIFVSLELAASSSSTVRSLWSAMRYLSVCSMPE